MLSLEVTLVIWSAQSKGGQREHFCHMCIHWGAKKHLVIFDNLVCKTKICLRDSLVVLNRNLLSVAHWEFKIEIYYKESEDFNGI